jgi:hypothetical protein
MRPRICQACHNQYATADKTEKKVLPHVDIAFSKVLPVSLNNILALYTKSLKLKKQLGQL